HEVAVAVAAQRVHEREVRGDRVLQDELGLVGVRPVAAARPDAERAHLLGRARLRDPARAVVPLGEAALGDLRADARAGPEPGDARATGAQLLRERALRRELQLELAREELPLELLVLPDVRARHLP